MGNSDLPVIMGTKLRSAELGAVFHLTPSAEQEGREAARIAAGILQAGDSGIIPVTSTFSLEIGINLAVDNIYNIMILQDIVWFVCERIYRRNKLDS